LRRIRCSKSWGKSLENNLVSRSRSNKYKRLSLSKQTNFWSKIRVYRFN